MIDILGLISTIVVIFKFVHLFSVSYFSYPLFCDLVLTEYLHHSILSPLFLYQWYLFFKLVIARDFTITFILIMFTICTLNQYKCPFKQAAPCAGQQPHGSASLLPLFLGLSHLWFPSATSSPLSSLPKPFFCRCCYHLWTADIHFWSSYRLSVSLSVLPACSCSTCTFSVERFYPWSPVIATHESHLVLFLTILCLLRLCFYWSPGMACHTLLKAGCFVLSNMISGKWFLNGGMMGSVLPIPPAFIASGPIARVLSQHMNHTAQDLLRAENTWTTRNDIATCVAWWFCSV